jgi:Tfp pilus assembly protein PilO
MRSGFDWARLNLKSIHRGVRFWLQTAVGILAISNAVALLLYFDPPGGSRAELTSQSQRLQFSINAAKAQALRLRRVSTQVQLGGQQAADFQSHYILPKRLAYESIIAEIQRIAQSSNLTERDGQMTEEPIEGTSDLSLLTNAVNFEGSYESLMRFLYAVDRSPQLLMLDTLTATPQKGGQITAQVRFQAVIREEQSQPAGGQP